MPREIGRHPETGNPILASIGRFGPYLKYGETFVSLPPDDDVVSLGLNRVAAREEISAKGPDR